MYLNHLRSVSKHGTVPLFLDPVCSGHITCGSCSGDGLVLVEPGQWGHSLSAGMAGSIPVHSILEPDGTSETHPAPGLTDEIAEVASGPKVLAVLQCLP